MSERRIAEFSDYDSMIEAMRQRLVEINITHTTFERLAGWPAGLCGKVFGDAQVKKLGPRTLAEAFEVLAIKAVIVEDAEAAARMADRWEERVRADYNAVRTASVGKTTINRMLPVISTEMQKRSRETYSSKKNAPMRRRVARTAARARWKSKRKVRKAKPAKLPHPTVQPSIV